MRADWVKTRQTKYTAYATVYILVVFALVAGVNYLVANHDYTYDSTSNKQFSLSEQTVKVVRGLKKDVHITYFDEQSRFPAARDTLDQYSNLSPKLHVDYVDPVKKPQQAKSAGYRRDVQILVDAGGPKKEEGKSLTEEEITGALIRALKTGDRNACVLSAGGEHSIDDTQRGGYSVMKQLLERDNYKVRTVDLKGGAPDPTKPVPIGQTAATGGDVSVPKDCTVLIVGGPQLEYPPTVVNAIKSYVEGGGAALIMLDNVVRLGKDEGAAENAGLTKVLADWGVTMNKDLVLDLSGVGQILGTSEEVPIVLAYDSHPITAPLERVPTAFPLVRSLDVKNGANTSVSKLFGTTDASVAVDASAFVGGGIDPRKGRKGPFTLAAAGTLTGANPQGRFVVVGTSTWSQNSLLGSRQLGNRDLLANMVNWLSADQDLISIRPKAPEDRPLNITPQKVSMLFWLSCVIFPLGVVAFGMVTWLKRR